MGHDGFRQRQLGGHQERGPVHGVEADDFLAHHVQVGGPVALELLLLALVGRTEAGGGDVVA